MVARTGQEHRMHESEEASDLHLMRNDPQNQAKL